VLLQILMAAVESLVMNQGAVFGGRRLRSVRSQCLTSGVDDCLGCSDFRRRAGPIPLHGICRRFRPRFWPCTAIVHPGDRPIGTRSAWPARRRGWGGCRLECASRGGL